MKSKCRQITVNQWSGYAQDEGDEVAKMLSDFLETPVRLFRYISDPEVRNFMRQQNKNITIPVETTFAYGYDTTFTDGFPYLIVNEVKYNLP